MRTYRCSPDVEATTKWQLAGVRALGVVLVRDVPEAGVEPSTALVVRGVVGATDLALPAASFDAELERDTAENKGKLVNRLP